MLALIAALILGLVLRRLDPTLLNNQEKGTKRAKQVCHVLTTQRRGMYLGSNFDSNFPGG
jgi:uncharacterized membrane-anchored protein YhcB (DUF1043 family)